MTNSPMDKTQILKLLKKMEIEESGIEVIGGNLTDVPTEVYSDLQQFKDGWTACLNEIKQAVLNL